MATSTSLSPDSQSEFLRSDKRQLNEKLVEELLCHQEQVKRTELLERVKMTEVSAGLYLTHFPEWHVFWGCCAKSEPFETLYVHALLLE